MREKQLQKLADFLDQHITALKLQSHAARPRQHLSREQLKEAMVFVAALRDGMTEAEYARQYPDSYQRLRKAMGRE